VEAQADSGRAASPPPPRAVSSYLDAVAEQVAATAGAALRGVWLTASAALGDFDPARSDLDVQALTDRELPAQARLALAADVAHGRLPCPARGLELVLYEPRGLAAADGPAPQLNVNTGARIDRRVELETDPAERFWYAIDVAIAREHGVALRGAEPAVLLPELPPALLVRALGEALDWFVANDRAGVATVLTACRARAWADDGRWRSKRDAAAWAAARSAVPGAIERAVAARADPAARLERGAVEAAVAEARASLAGA
jgi:hypothetical protein